MPLLRRGLSGGVVAWCGRCLRRRSAEVFGYDAAAGYVIADSDGNQEADMVIKLAGIRSDTRIAAIDFVYSDPIVV